jgi:hypothetical protein
MNRCPPHPSNPAPVFPVFRHCFLGLLSAVFLAAEAADAAGRAPWLVVGPWDMRLEGSLTGPEAGLRVAVTRLRITVDLDQPVPLAADAAEAHATPPPGAGVRVEAAAGDGIPAVDFPPFVKSVRVDGGELVLKHQGASTTLAWQGEFAQVRPGLWQGGFAARDAATDVAATVVYDAAERTWRVSPLTVRLDLAAWGPVAVQVAKPSETGWSMGGTILVDGQLVWNAAGVDGTVALTLRDGRIHSGDGKTSIEGADGTFRLTSLAGMTGPAGQRLTIRAVTAGSVAMTNVVVKTSPLPGRRFTLQVDADAFGGSLAVEPFEVDPAAPALHAAVSMADVQAQGILALFPDAPQGEAVLAGRVPLVYEGGRWGLGEGRLSLKPGTQGRIRFHHPGLFTGALSAWIPGRGALGRIETGNETLVVSELALDLYPSATPGRSAQIRIVGVPVDHPREGPFTFDFNINAPLETFINLGTQQKLRLQFK